MDHFAGPFSRLDVRFKGKFCYLDLYCEPELADGELPPPGMSRQEYLEHLRETPIHLCRLRYFSPDRWSFAFYSYASGRYEPSCFPSGNVMGAPRTLSNFARAFILLIHDPGESSPGRPTRVGPAERSA